MALHSQGIKSALLFTAEEIQSKFETKCCIIFHFVRTKLDTLYMYPYYIDLLAITFVLQNFDEVEFLEYIKELIRVDREWVPKIDNCSL